jgi:macrophage erythroblast attacher
VCCRLAFTSQTLALQVPFESLKRTTRDRKYAIDEVASVLDGIRRASQAKGSNPQQAATQLEGYVDQLKTLKRKVR